MGDLRLKLQNCIKFTNTLNINILTDYYLPMQKTYFPMQKFRKIFPKTSSVEISPTMLPI